MIYWTNHQQKEFAMAEWLRGLIAELNGLPPAIAGAMMSMVISTIRVLYDGKETKALRIFLEAILCGALSLTASAGISAMGLNVNWSVFAGGLIGYLGSNTVRYIAWNLITKKLRSFEKE
jgi:lambda family phage holin